MFGDAILVGGLLATSDGIGGCSGEGMKVEIDIPDFRFAIGDVVELPNEFNDKSILLKVIKGSSYGIWEAELRKDGVFTFAKEEELGVKSTIRPEYVGQYTMEVLPGSYHDSNPATEWAASDFLTLDRAEVDERGKLQALCRN